MNRLLYLSIKEIYWMKKVYLLFVSTTCFLLGSTAPEGIVVSSKPMAAILTDALENRDQKIYDACENPLNTILDFSIITLQPNDLDIIFDGLVARSLLKTKTKYCLTFLNLTSENISEEDVITFLLKCNIGKEVEGRRIYPDIRQTIVKIGFPLSESAVERLQTEAPSIFMGGLALVG